MYHRLVLAALFVAVLGCVRSGNAQGASVYTHGACTTSRAGAAVADPCEDASAVYYNPAALAMQRGAVSLGVTTVAADSRFGFDAPRLSEGMVEGPAFVPHLFASYLLDRGIALGIGAWAPYGLGSEWPLDFEGRFVGYDNQLRAIYVQPTVAVRLVPERLAIGAGLALVHGSVEINQRLDASEVPLPSRPFVFGRAPGERLLDTLVPAGTDFADLKLAGDDGAATFHLAIWAGPLDGLAIGVRYLHTARLHLEGRADFRAVPTGIDLPAGNPLGLPPGTPLDAVLAPLFGEGGPLVDQHLATNLELPAQLVMGLWYRLHPRAELLLDYQWTDWSAFDQAVLRFAVAPFDTLHLGWRDTNTWRLGTEYHAQADLALRGGFAFNTAATPDNGVTPLLPEADRLTFTAGAGYRVQGGLRFDAALEYATQQDRRGRVRPLEEPDTPAGEVNVGRYSGHVWVAAITMAYSLGRTLPMAVPVPPP